MTHLYSNQCHDESDVWCGKADYYRDGEPTSDPSKADCKSCLQDAAAFGARAAARLRDLGVSPACSMCGGCGEMTSVTLSARANRPCPRCNGTGVNQ